MATACLTPTMQFICHTGYQLPEYQARDLERLKEIFGLEGKT